MRRQLKAFLAALLALALLFAAGCGAPEENAEPEPSAEPTPTPHVHTWNDGVCTGCGKVCEHRWYNGVCRICGKVCLHRLEDGICEICGFGCDHAEHDPDSLICRRCGQPAEHSYVNGVCTRCGSQPEFVEALKAVPLSLSVPALAHGTTQTFHYPLEEGEIVPGAHPTVRPEDRKMRDLVVYLPAGYDPETQYNVIILVPGVGHDAHSWMEWPHFLNSAVGRLTGAELLDRMIENGLMEPTIVAVAEYYQRGRPEEVSGPFETDLRTRVLPFLAANFGTYASFDGDGNFLPAPEHFGYVGASFGAMVGWQMLPTMTDLFSYWSMLSGGFQNDEVITERIKAGVSDEHPIHWLYAGDGLLAPGWRAYLHRVEHLDEDCSCLNLGVNFSFLAADRTAHDYLAWDVGLINSMQLFFRSRYAPELLEQAS